MKNSSVQLVKPFRELKFISIDKVWICFPERLSTENIVELVVEAENSIQEFEKKIPQLEDFISRIDVIKTFSYEFILKNCFADSTKTFDQIQQMYFLSAVTMKNDNDRWWLVFEPTFEVETIDNHFIRLTISQDKIVWSNCSQK